MTEIESGSVLAMTDSTASDLLSELNTKRRRWRLWPLVFIIATAGIASLFAISAIPIWARIIGAASGIALTIFAYLRDRLRKTTVVFYELDSHAEETYQRFHDAFTALGTTAAMWHVGAQGQVRNSKYHAGASSLLRRQSVRPLRGSVPLLKTNVQIPTLAAGRQLLAFMPDRLLIFDSVGVGAVAYQEIESRLAQTRFIEEATPPRDAEIVGTTWRYVNKSGGPDRRFKNNRQLAIALYDELHLQSASGLNELFQVSRLGLAEAFVSSIGTLALQERSPKPTRRPPAPSDR